MKTSVPKVGNVYHFFDDGKKGISRQYFAKVERVVDFSKGNEIKFLFAWDEDDLEEFYDEDGYIPKTLIDIWEDAVEYIDWVFAKETDYFIECKIEEYDDYPIWFARTKDGDWFSLEIQNPWQGGLLDVDGKLDKYWKLSENN